MKYCDNLYSKYVEILKGELVPAMGCTEPISIAYAASIVKDYLKGIPSKLDIYVSGNILKNVKSVTVPNTNGMHGIDVAASIGILAGNSSKKLEVIADAKDDDIEKLKEYLKEIPIKIYHSESDSTLYIEIIGYLNSDKVRVIVKDSHTNVALIEKNNEVILKNDKKVEVVRNIVNKDILNVHDIVEFINIVDTNDIKEILDRQIKYNMAIANEGITNSYGANIGKTIIKYSSGDIISYCKALASAGSDARMNGCCMPVVINSGSGNQGITCSVPLIAYAEKKEINKEKLYKALALSNLITIHIKNSIGKLSAFCGVVIAGTGLSAGLSYINGGNEKEICHSIVNTLGIVSGILCDGAKSSCAAKIASSVEAGFLGYLMYKDGNQFYGGDGFIKKGVENTIKAIGKIARIGMCETDKEIIDIMLTNNEI